MRRVLLLVLLLAACSRAGDESEAKRAPAPPPPPQVEIPSDLAIAVTIDGATAPPITRDRLQALQPDFADAERRAWRLTSIVPELDQPGASVEARGPDGIAIHVERPAEPMMPAPVLFFTRRGDVVVAVIDPSNPFPGYHGQGGQLKRQGDPLPRLQPITALDVKTR